MFSPTCCWKQLACPSLAFPSAGSSASIDFFRWICSQISLGVSEPPSFDSPAVSSWSCGSSPYAWSMRSHLLLVFLGVFAADEKWAPFHLHLCNSLGTLRYFFQSIDRYWQDRLSSFRKEGFHKAFRRESRLSSTHRRKMSIPLLRRPKEPCNEEFLSKKICTNDGEGSESGFRLLCKLLCCAQVNQMEISVCVNRCIFWLEVTIHDWVFVKVLEDEEEASKVKSCRIVIAYAEIW